MPPMTGFAISLAPSFLLIALGYLIRRARVVDEGFWIPAEKASYYVFFPALLVTDLANADLSELRILPLAAALAAATAVVLLVLLVLRGRVHMNGPSFTSVAQGSVRVNTYVGIAVAVALFGDAGLTLAALCVAVLVPLGSVLSVGVLARYATPKLPTPWRLIWPIARNPLILACILGAALNLGSIHLPPVVGPMLDLVSKAALPMGLLTVGAGLDFSFRGVDAKGLIVAVLAKLALSPALAFATCTAFGVSGLTMTVAVLFAGLPASASSYVLARQFGGDAPLVAGIVTLETALSALTLPLLLALIH